MRLTTATAALVLGVSPAHGYAVPDVAPRAPAASLQVDGEATASDVRVGVRCASRGVFERGARCEVVTRFTVAARGRVTLTVVPRPDESVRVDGGAAGRALEAGERAQVVVTAARSFETDTVLRGGPWVLTPMAVRHPFLGETEGLERRAGAAEVVPFSGPSLTLDGGVSLDADGGRVRVTAAGHAAHVGGERGRLEQRVSVRMEIPARAAAGGPLRNGGPVLALGARMPMGEGEGGRFLLRGAWEVALWEHLFVSAGAETDFDSLLESVVVDVASPSYAVIVPSLRVGIGVVARQLGPRPADVALRLRAGGNLLPMGGDVDFDYWPAIDGWTLSVTGRLSP